MGANGFKGRAPLACLLELIHENLLITIVGIILQGHDAIGLMVHLHHIRGKRKRGAGDCSGVCGHGLEVGIHGHHCIQFVYTVHIEKKERQRRGRIICTVLWGVLPVEAL